MQAIKSPVSDAAPRPRHRIVADDKARRPRAGGSNLPILLVYLVAFLLFAGVVWFAWLETMGGRGEPPLVRAAQGPIKRPPDTVTGSDGDEASIASLLADERQPPHVERIAPRAATPPMTPLQAEPSLATPLVAPDEPAPPAAPGPMPGAVAAAPPSPAASQPTAAAQAATPAPTVARQALPAGNPAEPRSGEPSTRDAAGSRPAPGVAALPPPVPAIPPASGGPRQLVPTAAPPSAISPGAGPAPGPRQLIPTTIPPTAAPPVAAPAATPPAPRVAAVVAGGVWRIQIAALSSRAAVEQAWGRLRGQYPSELGSLNLFVEEVPGTGLWRMQAGGFADRDTAARVCTALKAGGSTCFVVGARS